jgi:hypothetical protein
MNKLDSVIEYIANVGGNFLYTHKKAIVCIIAGMTQLA